jgi:Outer membrane protein beta-barrel domain
MKKLTLSAAALLVLLFSMSASAQPRLGVIGGLNVGNLDADFDKAITKVSTKTFFGVGGVVDLRLNENFSLYMQPMYLRKGALVKDLQDNIEFPFTFAFLELPVFLKAEFGSAVRPYLMAGSTVGYLLSADVEGKYSGITFKGDMKEVTESLDFGLGFGAGVSYPLSTVSIFVEGRYTLGLLNMQKGGTFEISAGPIVQEITWNKDVDAYKNRGIQIMAGVSFALGGR